MAIQIGRGLFRLWLVISLCRAIGSFAWVAFNPRPLWCGHPIVRETGSLPSEEERNPFAKYVDRDRATPPTWREEAQCVIFYSSAIS